MAFPFPPLIALLTFPPTTNPAANFQSRHPRHPPPPRSTFSLPPPTVHNPGGSVVPFAQRRRPATNEQGKQCWSKGRPRAGAGAQRRAPGPEKALAGLERRGRPVGPPPFHCHPGPAGREGKGRAGKGKRAATGEEPPPSARSARPPASPLPPALAPARWPGPSV